MEKKDHMDTETEELIRTLIKNTMDLARMHRDILEMIKTQDGTMRGLLERVKALETRQDAQGEEWKQGDMELWDGGACEDA